MSACCTERALPARCAGVGTLTTIVTMLETHRPVVVLAGSGGVADAITHFCARGALPTNELRADDKAFGMRQALVEACAKTLPRIRELGAAPAGPTNAPLLSMFKIASHEAGGTEREVREARDAAAAAFTSSLIQTIMASCPRALDNLAHAVSWAQPEMLRVEIGREVSATGSAISQEVLARVWQHALFCAMSTSDHASPAELECVRILMEAGAEPAGVCFNALNDAKLGRFTKAVPIEEIEQRLRAVTERNYWDEKMEELRRQATTKPIGKKMVASAPGAAPVKAPDRSVSPYSLGRIAAAASSSAADTVSQTASQGVSFDVEEMVRLGSGVVSEGAQLADFRASQLADFGASQLADFGSLESVSATASNTAAVISIQAMFRGRHVRKAVKVTGTAQIKSTESSPKEQEEQKENRSKSLLAVDGLEMWRKINPQNALGLYVLHECASVCGYRINLRARYRLGDEAHLLPNFMDLFMWAILFGDFELAQILWLRAPNPCRAAIMGSKVCQKLKETCDAAYAVELESAAHMLEGWAEGALDQIKYSEDAFDLLTCVPTLQEDGSRPDSVQGRPVRLWPCSVLGDAASNNYPCRRFVSHRHCQFVLDQYLVGRFRGSRAAVPTTVGIFQLLLQMLCHMITLVCLGRCELRVCDVTVPRFLPLPEDAPIGSPKRPGSPGAASASDEHGIEDEEQCSDNETTAGLESEGGCQKPSWTAFWQIPLVNFVAHTVWSVVMIFLSVLLLTGHTVSVEDALMAGNVSADTMAVEITGADPSLPPANFFDQSAMLMAVEVFYVLFIIGKTFEELRQVIVTCQAIEYIKSFWNKLDVLFVLLSGFAIGMRVALTRTAIRYEYGVETEISISTINLINLVRFDLQVLALMVLIIRFIECLTYSPKMAEVFVMLSAMVSDVLPVLAFVLIVMLTSGIALVCGTCVELQTSASLHARTAAAAADALCSRRSLLRAVRLAAACHTRCKFAVMGRDASVHRLLGALGLHRSLSPD